MRRLLVGPALILLSFIISSLAQSDEASISGRITDQTGLALKSVEVEVTNVETGLALLTLTNTEGIYVMGDLRPGAYRVTAKKEGFRSIVLDGLTLNVQDSLGRNFIMQVGPVASRSQSQQVKMKSTCRQRSARL